MSDAVGTQKDENLAQLGIKQGSIFWPILATLVALLVLFVYVQKPEKSVLAEMFENGCVGASGLEVTDKVTSPLAKRCFTAATDEERIPIYIDFADQETGMVARWNAVNEVIYSNEKNPAHKAMENFFTGKKIWALFVESVRDYTKELFSTFGDIIVNLFIAMGVVALVALIPGFVGMIYRRNFWGWFLVPFVGLFAATSGVIGQKSPEASILVFVLSQLVIVLLALRLRRFSRSTNPIPASVYNWGLAIALFLVAVAWWYDIGGVLWSSWAGWFQWEFIFVGLPILYTLLRRSDIWSGRAPKNIVICLDGTTNTPDQYEFGRLAQTNVFKLFKMLKADVSGSARRASVPFNASLSKRYKDKQIALYYSGVGNKFEYDPIVQMLGGATGLGAANVVDRAYLDLVRIYRPGDRIFIVGFSRGAAIARLLARAIDQRGAPKTIWTLRLFGRYWTIWQNGLDKPENRDVPVTVLGCFDTVGAFGIAKNVGGIDFQKMDLFKDLTVPDNVEQAYHMVALDEMREEFQPTLMDPDPIKPARIIEVWFSGDHANIGGGWATTKLSDLTLDFLLRKISSGYAANDGMAAGNESWGLYLSAVNAHNKDATEAKAAGAYVLEPDPLGQLRQWHSALYVYKPRQLPDHAVLSETVFERMTKAKPLYAPQSLFNLHDALNAKRDSITDAVTKLKDTQSLSAEEHDAVLAFKDKLHLTRWPQYAAGLSGATKPETVLDNGSENPEPETTAS